MFGATTAERLKKNRSYVIIGSFVVGMILTPPDIISQILIAIPIWLLFEVGLFFAPFFKVRKTVKQVNTKKSEPQKNNWTDESHNAMMDEVESEMNKQGGLDQQ